MSFLTYVTSLHAHGEWADRRLLEALRGAEAPVALRELAHVRGAQDIWLARIEQRAPSLAVWPELTVDELATVGESIDVAMRDRLATLTEPELAEPVAYRNMAGESFTTPLSEILLHLMLHGHYHRGKASVALRAATGAAVGVDYILWRRSVATDPL